MNSSINKSMSNPTKIMLLVILHILILIIVFLPSIIFKFVNIQPYQRGFYCDDEAIRYPFKKSTISFALVTSIGLILGIGTIVITEIVLSVRTLRDLTKNYFPIPRIVIHIYTYIGLFIFGIGFDQFLTNTSKYAVGRLRPHFISACMVNWTNIYCGNHNYVHINNEQCLQTDEYTLMNMRLSFPSGHSSFSAYCAVAICIYVWKRWTISNPLYIVRALYQAILLIIAVLCGLSRVSDYKHHPTDVLAGLISGSIVAIITFHYLNPVIFGSISGRDQINGGAVGNIADRNAVHPQIQLENYTLSVLNSGTEKILVTNSRNPGKFQQKQMTENREETLKYHQINLKSSPQGTYDTNNNLVTTSITTEEIELQLSPCADSMLDHLIETELYKQCYAIHVFERIVQNNILDIVKIYLVHVRFQLDKLSNIKSLRSIHVN